MCFFVAYVRNQVVLLSLHGGRNMLHRRLRQEPGSVLIAVNIVDSINSVYLGFNKLLTRNDSQTIGLRGFLTENEDKWNRWKFLLFLQVFLPCSGGWIIVVVLGKFGKPLLRRVATQEVGWLEELVRILRLRNYFVSISFVSMLKLLCLPSSSISLYSFILAASMRQVGTTLMQEFRISWSHTEWNLLSLC